MPDNLILASSKSKMGLLDMVYKRRNNLVEQQRIHLVLNPYGP